jgi:hypothetical protein
MRRSTIDEVNVRVAGSTVPRRSTCKADLATRGGAVAGERGEGDDQRVEIMAEPGEGLRERTIEGLAARQRHFAPDQLLHRQLGRDPRAAAR